MPDFDETVDVVVVGSGVGGMTAAVVTHDLGGSVMVLEKGPVYGGSSAMSGGTVWVPGNDKMQAAGIEDSVEDGYRYCRSLVGDGVSDDRLRAYLHTAPAVIRYLEEHTDLRFVTNTRQPDYYPESDGAVAGGRSLNPVAFHARSLGTQLYAMRGLHPQCLIFGRVGITAQEAHRVVQPTFSGRMTLMGILLRYVFDLRGRLRGRRDRRLTMGNALIGPLRLALLRRQVPVHLSTPVLELVADGGRVVGIIAQRAGKPLRVRARRGVLLAAGGFERNQAMRDEYLQQPTQVAWSAANPLNEGDGIQMARAVGAQLAFMERTWAMPTAVVPGQELAWLLVTERALPGCVVVDRDGQRYMDESIPYQDAVSAMYAHSSDRRIPSYLIFDARYRKKYPCGPVMPGQAQPDFMLSKKLRTTFLRKSRTLTGLADQLGIPAERLEATIARFNEHARAGEDPDFHKGSSRYGHYYGDASVGPNPCLGPVETPPFYAIEIVPGDLGTNGGVATDARARVLDAESIPIPGLYATGNCSSPVMGGAYPGAGATLGPSMTFGYIAAYTAMGNDEESPEHRDG